MQKSATEIVLTGGPCAGKTTALSYISEKLMDKGFRVFIVPEVATMVISGGVQDIERLAKGEFDKYLAVQRIMLRIQKDLRKRFNELADTFPDEKRVILYDRAYMDIKSYVGEDCFKAFLKEEKLNLVDVRDSFGAVIHLVTAAIGAREFYTLENNSARCETVDEASYADERTMHAWVGHPHLRVIDNSTDFERKMKRTLKAITRVLGIPAPLEIERKFLIRGIPDLSAPPFNNAEEIFIEQIYLISKDDSILRIRKRTQDGASIYYRTRKLRISDLVRHETEEMISALDYVRMQEFRDPDTQIIKKRRYCFLYKYQYFELDIFDDPAGCAVLEIELTEENDSLELPPFIDIEREVTEDPEYTNYQIARKSKS